VIAVIASDLRWIRATACAGRALAGASSSRTLARRPTSIWWRLSRCWRIRTRAVVQNAPIRCSSEEIDPAEDCHGPSVLSAFGANPATPTEIMAATSSCSSSSLLFGGLGFAGAVIVT